MDWIPDNVLFSKEQVSIEIFSKMNKPKNDVFLGGGGSECS